MTLDRGKPLKRGKPPKRGKRIKPVGQRGLDKRAEMAEVRVRDISRRWPCEAQRIIDAALETIDRGEVLHDRRGAPIDPAWAARVLVDARRACRVQPVDPHHVRKAGLGGENVSAALLALCRPCHDLTEHETGLCYAIGLLR